MLSIEHDCPSIDTSFGVVFTPKIQVDVKLAAGIFQRFEFLVDSGADVTVLPYSMAPIVGYPLPSAPDVALTGIDGRSTLGYSAHITLKIGNQEHTIRCIFTESDLMPFLLGRVDFFHVFNVLFDGKLNKLTLIR